MANWTHLSRLNLGLEGWNRWRGKKSQEEPDLTKADLSKADLSGFDLTGVNLSEANLSEANLIGADLTGANLTKADLSSANLKEARFSKANLIGANLSGANMNKTDLWGANLSEASLSGADLTGAVLSGADLWKADLWGVVLSGSILWGTILWGAVLSGAVLNKAVLKEAVLKEADLSGANLSDADLSKAVLYKANLSGADLSGAILSRANLSGANLSRADLSGADLHAIQALGTHFTAAKLTGACLEDWKINNDTNLDEVDCEYVYLKYDDLERRPSIGVFASGEFIKLFGKDSGTVEFTFRNGVNWEALAYAFQKIQATEAAGDKLALQSIENQDDEVVVVKVSVSPDANQDIIYRDMMQHYEDAQPVLAARARHAAENNHLSTQVVENGAKTSPTQPEDINNFFYLLSQQPAVQKFVAENPQLQQSFRLTTPMTNFPGYRESDTRDRTPEAKLALSETASQIQHLLNQLVHEPNSNGAVTETVYQAIQRNPMLKARLQAAQATGGLEALKAIFNHPMFNISAETVLRWLEAE